ncbi:MAG: sigma-54-dependent Fis family transcriptional regulator [Acidobacteria bacterium]|nr:sigma-54-dependent Fis family transcriptional regulator [Acidobacteriota bacterium]
MENGRSKVLIVEDDRLLREQLWWALKAEYRVLQAGDREEGLQSVRRERPDLVLLDLHLPPDLGSKEGLQLLREIRRHAPESAVIVMTADADKECALRAIEAGAYDYFRKPFDLQELGLIIRRALERVRMEKENRLLRERLSGEISFHGILGISREMRDVFEAVRRVAECDATVILLGESGTGKDMVARAIHEASPRRAGPFVAVQCSAIPEHLIESELFGHEKGAYTGAVDSRPGRFEMASGGTLFLDEVGTMSPAIQAKLLRVLEQQEFLRLGGKTPVRVDVRVITATNEDLVALMRDGRFREDLYFRIHVFPIQLPPLRRRREDIPLLADHFLKALCSANGLPPKTLTGEAMARLVESAWRGNVRELRNFITTLVLTADGDRITPADLPAGLAAGPAPGAEPDLLAGVGNGMSLPEAIAGFEVRLLRRALDKAGGIKMDAAKLLGIDKNRMMYLCRKHQL